MEKLIDKMAEYIAGLDIDEDVCKKIDRADCNKKTCAECVKEYFKGVEQ